MVALPNLMEPVLLYVCGLTCHSANRGMGKPAFVVSLVWKRHTTKMCAYPRTTSHLACRVCQTLSICFYITKFPKIALLSLCDFFRCSVPYENGFSSPLDGYGNARIDLLVTFTSIAASAKTSAEALILETNFIAANRAPVAYRNLAPPNVK